MKISEFIKMLQEADPTGEAYIRMGCGVPKFAELKPGYYDGPYSYIDEDGNWNHSTQGNKVDIHCFNVGDFVESLLGIYKIIPFEEVVSRFKYNLSYTVEEQRKERENVILREAKEAYDDIVELYEKFQKEGEEIALLNSDKGWTWFQNKLVDEETIGPNMHHYYTWKVYDENGKEQGSNPYNVQFVYKSGLFERHDNGAVEGYYQWIKRNN